MSRVLVALSWLASEALVISLALMAVCALNWVRA